MFPRSPVKHRTKIPKMSVLLAVPAPVCICESPISKIKELKEYLFHIRLRYILQHKYRYNHWLRPCKLHHWDKDLSCTHLYLCRGIKVHKCLIYITTGKYIYNDYNDLTTGKYIYNDYNDLTPVRNKPEWAFIVSKIKEIKEYLFHSHLRYTLQHKYRYNHWLRPSNLHHWDKDLSCIHLYLCRGIQKHKCLIYITTVNYWYNDYNDLTSEITSEISIHCLIVKKSKN